MCVCVVFISYFISYFLIQTLFSLTDVYLLGLKTICELLQFANVY